jgi:hypothetical protein
MNSETDYGIRHQLAYVNGKLAGKTIQNITSDNPKRAYLSFSDGSIGMVEVLNEVGKEPYLAIMPPNEISDVLRKGLGSECLTSKMSETNGWHDTGSAGGVTDNRLRSIALLGSFFSLESFGNGGCALHFEYGENKVCIKIPTLNALTLYSFLGQYLDDRQPTDPRLGRMLSHPEEGIGYKVVRSRKAQ